MESELRVMQLVTQHLHRADSQECARRDRQKDSLNELPQRDNRPAEPDGRSIQHSLPDDQSISYLDRHVPVAVVDPHGQSIGPLMEGDRDCYT